MQGCINFGNPALSGILRRIWDENSTGRKVIGKETRPIINWDAGTSAYHGTITDTNKGAWPENGQFKFDATSSGVKVKWTGYDGVNYESNLQ